MELRDALRARRMVRSYDGRPIDAAALEAMCRESLRAPTAGNAAGVSLVVVPADLVANYFAAATDAEWRTTAARAPGLQRAGAAVIVVAEREKYVARYTANDKVASGLNDPAAWSVPYWHTDAAMATMALLLLIEEAGWAATMWGSFRHAGDVLRFAGAPEGAELFCSVLVGHPDGHDRRSASLDREGLRRIDRVRRLALE